MSRQKRLNRELRLGHKRKPKKDKSHTKGRKLKRYVIVQTTG